MRRRKRQPPHRLNRSTSCVDDIQGNRAGCVQSASVSVTRRDAVVVGKRIVQDVGQSRSLAPLSRHVVALPEPQRAETLALIGAIVSAGETPAEPPVHVVIGLTALA
jgi:hypothetical protein